VSMDNKERNFIKKKILKCLTEDFKGNQAIFDKEEGWAVFNGTNLDMVMDKVCKGLEMAKYDWDEKYLNKKIKKASKTWVDVKDPDKWVQKLRGKTE
jgi:hypothetical protein